LGETEKHSEGNLFQFTRFSYNFALDEVRDYKFELAQEAISNYDLDGLDLDFCRFPRLFPANEAKQCSHLIDDLVRKIKTVIDKKSAQIGRKIYLSVRVPPAFDLAKSFGIDVETWINEGLIDILIAGVVHTSMFRVPVEEYVKKTRDKNVQVIAQNLGLFWHDRPLSAKVLWHEPSNYTTEMCRACAANYWKAGVDGIYIFNNHLIEFVRDSDYDHQPWREIADPALLSRKNKHYLVDNPHNWQGVANEMGAPPIPKGPLPVDLMNPGDTANVTIDIADDIKQAAIDGAFEKATLRILVVNLTSIDSIEFSLNGMQLDFNAAQKKLLYNDCWIEFDVSDSVLIQGWNSLRMKVIERNSNIMANLVVESVEVIIRYL